MTINRKIGKHAAHEIANHFIQSRRENLDRVYQAFDESEKRLQEIVNELVRNSGAKQWFDKLSDEDKQYHGELHRRDLTFQVEVSHEDMTETTVLRAHLDGWWYLNSHELTILRMCGVETSSLNLRAELCEKMTCHPAAIENIKARRAMEQERKNMSALYHRIAEDIRGRKVKDVLEAWPELTNAINKQYPQPTASAQQPLQTPLADVIASISTPLITSEDTA